MGVKRRKRGDRKFRCLAFPDENDDTIASMRVIGRKNARLGVGAIRSLNREFRDPERRRVTFGFLHSDKIYRIRRDKV